MSIVTKDNPSVARAIAVLQKAANKNRPEIMVLLKRAGLEAVSPASPPKIGQLVVYSSRAVVYMGTWEPNPGQIVHTGFDPDFLRDRHNKQLIMNFNDAEDEFAKRHRAGRRYGSGGVTDLCRAIADGSYVEGDPVLSPLEFLNGRNITDGSVIRPVNLDSLLTNGNPSVQTIRDTISYASSGGRCAVSGSEHPVHPSQVYHASLTDGGPGWPYKDDYRSGVVPFRVFKNAPGIGG